ncbi:MAG TPA: DUF3052 domain-containing protein [Candidatus Angelobacter sp.]|nr:DUF3052 domain-containing protein [Candidatus Angelobacter sp.]
MAGYSGTPLVQKIGIKAGHRLLLRNDPPGFLGDLGRLPEGVAPTDRLASKANVAVYFTDKLAALEKDFAALARAIEPDGMLWVAWPKKASGKPTDLTEDVVRRVALERGLVDVKVCAIDETWSGLKLVVRLKDRPAKKAGTNARGTNKKKEQ